MYIIYWVLSIYVPGPPPRWYPPPPLKPRGEDIFPSSFLFLSFFFPSSFLSSFLPFFLSSFQARSTAHHHHRGRRCFATIAVKQPLSFQWTLVASTYNQVKLYICSCNLCRVLVININSHRTTTPHHRGEGETFCDYCNQATFVFSVNSCCFYIQTSKALYLFMQSL